MAANRVVWASPSRIFKSIGNGHFMERFKPKPIQDITDIGPRTKVKRYLKVAEETIANPTKEDVENLKIAQAKIENTVNVRTRIDTLRSYSIAVVVIGGSLIADALNKLGASATVVRAVIGIVVAAYFTWAITSWKRINNTGKLDALNTRIENKLCE